MIRKKLRVVACAVLSNSRRPLIPLGLGTAIAQIADAKVEHQLLCMWVFLSMRCIGQVMSVHSMNLPRVYFGVSARNVVHR